MQAKFVVAIATLALAGVAQAQTQDRTAGEAARDTAKSVGAAAKAAVTPGDQDMGRNPNNRTGGLMGTDKPTGAAITPGDQNMGRDPNNRSGGLMGKDSSATTTTTADTNATTTRRARADRN